MAFTWIIAVYTIAHGTIGFFGPEKFTSKEDCMFAIPRIHTEISYNYHKEFSLRCVVDRK
jgi:hypothetical protein